MDILHLQGVGGGQEMREGRVARGSMKGDTTMGKRAGGRGESYAGNRDEHGESAPATYKECNARKAGGRR